MEFLVAIIIVSIGVFILICTYLNEYDLPILKLEEFLGKKRLYRILLIDPHPDDETMLTGGFIAKFGKRKDVSLKHICLTKGEKGDEILKLTKSKLAKIREVEYVKATRYLDLNDYEIWNIADGEVENDRDKVKNKIKTIIQNFRPDLVVTYEKDGLYGHPDHIALSEVVHELFSEQSKKSSGTETVITFKVLYKTLPVNILKHKKLPTHMANGKKISPAIPTLRLPVWGELYKKYLAINSHKSQKLGQGPLLWLRLLLLNNEYFTDKY